MSAWTCRQVTVGPTQRLFHLVLEPLAIKGHSADCDEKCEPVSAIGTGAVESLNLKMAMMPHLLQNPRIRD
jgi:hypothetical protein